MKDYRISKKQIDVSVGDSHYDLWLAEKKSKDMDVEQLSAA